MRIKKIAAIMLATAMAINMCACTAKEEKTETTESTEAVVAEEKSSFDEAAYLDKITAEVTENLAALSMEEGFLELYSANDDVKDILDDIKGAKIDTSKDYYEMMLEGDMINRYMDLQAHYDDSEEITEFSETTKEYLNRLFSGNIVSMFNSRKGVDYVVLTSVFGYGRTYVPEGTVANRIRIIPTDKDVYYFVSYYNTGDGALTVSANFIFYDDEIAETFKPLFSDDLKTITR